MIYRLIDKCDIITFDIFDTLIERQVLLPSDIFNIVSESLSTSNSFRNDRIDAERISRSLKGEVKLQDIYEALDSKYSYELKKMLMEKELEVEYMNCYRKENVYKYFEYALHKGKKIFLISDMYLEKEFIVKMLDKCNILGYRDCYVSNEVGYDKKSGKLFEYVVTQNLLQSKKVLHIGDNIKADIIGARKAGILGIYFKKSRLIRRSIQKTCRKFYK